MAAEMDSSLVSQCLAFCQTLASQGKAFNFKLTNTSFSFSLDTKGINAKSTVDKKRISPSTQRRNARRREEFLKKKLNFVSPSPSVADTPAGGPPASTPVAATTSTSFSTAASAGSVSTPAPTPTPRPPIPPVGWEPRRGARGNYDCPPNIRRRPETIDPNATWYCGFGWLWRGGICHNNPVACRNGCTLNDFEQI